MTLTVRDVMTTNVAAVGPEATLKQVAELMVDRGVSGVPVVDADHRILGIVSEADIVVKAVTRPAGGVILALLSGREIADERRLNATTAYEAMTEPAVTIAADRTLAEAARVLMDARVNRLPVAVNGRLVGILTRGDLVRAFIRPDGDIWEDLHAELGAGHLAGVGEDIEVSVHGGQVSLRGKVETAGAAHLLEAAVRRVPGVVAVDSSGLQTGNGNGT
jgi:CBS domain-containing protein